MTSRFCSAVAVALLSTFFFGAFSPVLADKVNIGHLETNDDIGINWLYFTCDKSNSSEMRCDIFQTLIMKKKTQAEIDTEFKQALTDPLAEFNKNFGATCKPLIEVEAKMQEAINSGIGLDGKPINARVVRSGLPMIKATIDTCKNPTQESASTFFKYLINQNKHTCKAHTDYSQSVFTLDIQTNSWISKEGPTGACGTIVLGTLSQDPNNHFWHYVEKRLRTNPKGILSTGQSCEQFPEYTMNYTWQTTSTAEGCDFIESMPD